jgi:amino acid adenylation domain-containing protein
MEPRTRLVRIRLGSATGLSAFEESNYSLDIRINAGADLLIVAKFDQRRLNIKWVETLLARFKAMLTNVSNDATVTINKLYELIPSERAFLRNFHNTSKVRDWTMTLPHWLTKTARQSPSKIAFYDKVATYSYCDTDRISSQLSFFLFKNGCKAGDKVAFLMDRSGVMAISILGAWRSHAVYVPLDPDQPEGRLSFVLNDSKPAFVFTDRNHLDLARKLQWSAKHPIIILCLDHIHDDDYSYNTSDKELWEIIGEQGSNAIEQGGWFNSYDGAPFSEAEMDEYAENVYIKLHPHITTASKVLEIGCASGITLSKFADVAKEYIGIDHSEVIIQKNQQRFSRHKNVSFKPLAAHQVDQVDGLFDVIILNSVIQSFPGYRYFEDVIRKCIKKLKPNGILFLGDLMDAGKREEMTNKFIAYKNSGRGSLKTKTDWTSELFIDRQYLNLLFDVTGCEIIVYEKSGELKNELTDFRFDALVRVLNNTIELKMPMVFDFSILGEMNEAVTTQPEDLAYIIYTSGSSGTPKGAMIEHQGMINHIYSKIDLMGVDQNSRIAQNASQCFDISIWQFFTGVLKGAATGIYDNDTILDPFVFIQKLETDKVNILELVPSYLAGVLEEDWMQSRSVAFPQLKYLMLTGEQFLPELARRMIAKRGQTILINAYGPTEASDDITHFVFSELPSTMTLPIGAPVQNMRIRVVQDRQRVCGPMAVGEIVVTGIGVGRGYINDEVRTKAAFGEGFFEIGQRDYFTGDLGRIWPDGNIEFLGRIDDQVKLNGFRIETGEIENNIMKMNVVKEAAVILHKQMNVLVAFVTIQGSYENDVIEMIPEQLRSFLPLYMVPSRIIILKSLPVNKSGKIDRKKLSSMVTVADRKEMALTATERSIAAIWSDVLSVTTVHPEDNFFMIGGHSLKASQVTARIHYKMGISVGLKILFANPTLREFAQQVDKMPRVRTTTIPKALVASYYPLSPAQKRMWFIDQFEEGGNKACNIPEVYFFRGHMDLVLLEKAFRDLIARHEILRTTFKSVDGEPVQTVHPAGERPFFLDFIDLSNEKNCIENAKRIADTEAHKSFDISKDVLLRVLAIKLKADEYCFCYTLHHIVGDGWSMQLLRKEMQIFYESQVRKVIAPLPELTVQYKDYAVWQVSRNLLSSEKYWMDKLRDISFIRLPYDRPDLKDNKFKGDNISLSLPDHIASSLYTIALEQNTTISSVMFAMFNILIYKLTNQNSIYIGVANANRSRKELENLMGFFINVIILKTEFRQDPDIYQVIRDVRDEMLSSIDHQDYPFELLVQQINPQRISNNQPLFNVGYGFQNFSDIKTDSDNVHFDMDLTLGNQQMTALFQQEFNTSKYDLTLFVYELQKSLVVRFEYNAQFFYKETMQNWLQSFHSILEAVATSHSKITVEA